MIRFLFYIFMTLGGWVFFSGIAATDWTTILGFIMIITSIIGCEKSFTSELKKLLK